MPGMPVIMGQPMPGVVPNMLHGTHSGCSAYAGTYFAAADPMLTYFSAIAGQSGFIHVKLTTSSMSIRNRSFH